MRTYKKVDNPILMLEILTLVTNTSTEWEVAGSSPTTWISLCVKSEKSYMIEFQNPQYTNKNWVVVVWPRGGSDTDMVKIYTESPTLDLPAVMEEFKTVALGLFTMISNVK